MEHEFGLHELAIEDARKTNQRPKIDEYGNELFSVLKTIEIEGDEFHVGEIDRVHRPELRAVGPQRNAEGLRRRPQPLRARAAPPEAGSGFVFYALMDAVVDRYFPVLDQLEKSWIDREPDLLQRLGALDDRVAVFAEEQADDPEACGVAADGGGRESCTAAACQGRRRDG
jgi:magnesium transporter